jgi:hypothetical protein
LKSAVDILFREHLSVILEYAKTGGASVQEANEAGKLLQEGPSSFYSRVLRRVDQWTAAYGGDQSIYDWVGNTVAPVVWMVRETDRESTIVHVAAAAAAMKSIVPNGTTDELNLCVIEVVESMNILLDIFQYAVTGYLSAHTSSEQILVD